MCGCGNSALPETMRHAGSLKHGMCSLRDRLVRFLGDAVLLRCVRRGEFMYNSLLLDILVELRR